MHTSEYYKRNSKMFDLICQQPSLLQMMSRFGIPLGVEEKSVEEVCNSYGVDPDTFLAVANFIKFGPEAARDLYSKVSVETLVNYLKQAHDYFLDFELPAIRRKLLEAIVCSNTSEVSNVVGLIVKFYDDYTEEVRNHMQHENSDVFTYVDDLLKGKKRPDFRIEMFARSHESINNKLQELKNIIIKYYKPAAASDLLNSMMYDIFVCEYDLRRHCEVENCLFVPAVKRLEQRIDDNLPPQTAEENTTQESTLSQREKEIVALVVKGMKNKDIAEKLFISVHTVLTHRKNISHKLDIHSVSGLTIYAIVNGIVNIEDLDTK